jgi:hypothetical protein
MKYTIPQLHLVQLRRIFPVSLPIRKAALKNFYRQQDQSLTEQAFRRILYALEKHQALAPIGAGLYALQESSISRPPKKQFDPLPSPIQDTLGKTMREIYPYLDYLMWETRLLHEWMTHQPGGNQIILETEKDACESVFNHLREQYLGQVFLEPDRPLLERYVLPLPESILIARLVSQSPKRKLNGLTTPRLEKILVDIFADPELFFVFQGDELARIYENAFGLYWISEKTMFRYAGRRKVEAKLKEFIQTRTNIKLNQP